MCVCVCVYVVYVRRCVCARRCVCVCVCVCVCDTCKQFHSLNLTPRKQEINKINTHYLHLSRSHNNHVNKRTDNDTLLKQCSSHPSRSQNELPPRVAASSLTIKPKQAGTENEIKAHLPVMNVYT